MLSLLDRLGARVLRSRRAVRAPIWLYQRRLGWLIGTRILMLEHVGRRSDTARYVCLEVVERPNARTIIIIVSGFGQAAQWYRNLRATPTCHVSIGGIDRAPARATFLTDKEMSEVLCCYRKAHPRAGRRLRGAIEQATGAAVTSLPGVRLDLLPPPRSEGRPW